MAFTSALPRSAEEYNRIRNRLFGGIKYSAIAPWRSLRLRLVRLRAVCGKKGKVVIGESKKVVGIKSWSLELSLDTLETTDLGSDWKKFITGLKEWSASSDGDYEVPTDTEGQKALQEAYLSGAAVTVKLYVDEKNFYTGLAFISSLSIEDPVDDIVSISIEFTGSDILTFDKEA